MTQDVFPSVKIAVLDGQTLQVTLPVAEQTVYPRVPPALHGREVPGFLLEWVVEADEIGVIIQELLQAPTRSLCRIMRIYSPTGRIGPTEVTRPVVRGPGGPGVQVRGFGAEDQIAGLPEGIRLPGQLLTIVEMARRLDAWIEKGRRVREWLDAEGLGDLSWLPQQP